MASNKRIGAIGEDDNSDRWAQYRQYLERMNDNRTVTVESNDTVRTLKGKDLKPVQVTKLKEFSRELERLQETDFQARQLKSEIDRLLQEADGGGGWLRKFASKSDD
jgi:hypothetical protein